MGRECQALYSRLSELLAEKRDTHKSVMMNCIRSKLCYALLKSCLLCLRGSSLRNRNITKVEQDIAVQYELCSIRQIHKLFDRDIRMYNIIISKVTINCKLMTAAAYNLQCINSM